MQEIRKIRFNRLFFQQNGDLIPIYVIYFALFKFFHSNRSRLSLKKLMIESKDKKAVDFLQNFAKIRPLEVM